MEGMTTVYMGLLLRGPKAAEWDAKPDELAQLQQAHLANMEKMRAAGKLILAGPFTDDGHLRGVYIFKTASLAEAQELADTDPSVQAGRLAFEIHPWMIQSGILPGT